jgi:hypothetical protein
MFLLALTSAWLAAAPAVPTAGQITGELDGQPIYGGTEADPGEWPAVVGISTGKLCTGTLVAPDLVLTAAHCFDPEPTGPVQVYFGDSLGSAKTVLASSWAKHPEYCVYPDCSEDVHDFAWIRLSSPVSVAPIVPITDQAEFDEVMRVGTSFWFVGFGENEDGVLGIKREVEATLTEFNESGREFRAGGGGKDTCYGDSGGPALVQPSSGQWRLAGVISRGAECGEGGVYGVPLPELCWLRDSSGVDLLPPGCEACDCVQLHGDAPEQGCDCDLAAASERGRGWWIALELGVLLGIVAATRWRRTRAP